MYHDTIHINFNYSGGDRDINFEYSFLISKNIQNPLEGMTFKSTSGCFAPIKYSELLQKFGDLGFDLKYLKFNDIDDLNTMVYCTYNYQSNFDIFFSAYKKIIQHKNFNITFEYGNVINGKFWCNNMNTFSGVNFISAENNYGRAKKCAELNKPIESIIKGKKYYKTSEHYQIIDKNARVIDVDFTTVEQDFEQHFFESYKVKVALRKFKLSQLKKRFE